jgi:hypothetical protein
VQVGVYFCWRQVFSMKKRDAQEYIGEYINDMTGGAPENMVHAAMSCSHAGGRSYACVHFQSLLWWYWAHQAAFLVTCTHGGR